MTINTIAVHIDNMAVTLVMLNYLADLKLGVSLISDSKVFL